MTPTLLTVSPLGPPQTEGQARGGDSPQIYTAQRKQQEKQPEREVERVKTEGVL